MYNTFTLHGFIIIKADNTNTTDKDMMHIYQIQNDSSTMLKLGKAVHNSAYNQITCWGVEHFCKGSWSQLMYLDLSKHFDKQATIK